MAADDTIGSSVTSGSTATTETGRTSEELKVLVELCKQMGAEVASLGKSNNVQDGKSSYGENTDGKTTPKQPGEDGLPQGTYIVGGSAFGWNFITYSGQEPVYYGVTKEDFRAKYPGPWFVSN
ncbi:uncharacterized protein G2W53_018763 [Senna tora]|uniref:Uncharacterized protein n=1 Tax=Senna tora TaxID=362788 RepID=A0A834WRQ4_9FABA|nr:uncharacterized protein G2W53_018763 [Senna tora]